MNWCELDEIERRAISNEMTQKEATDGISPIFDLIKLINFEHKCGINHPMDDYDLSRLMDIAIVLVERGRRPDPLT